MVFETDNPYRSPATVDRGLMLQRPLRSGARGRLLGKGLLYRRILIEAPIETVLEFDGRSLCDVVRVDNQVVAWKFSWWRITPYFRFSLAAGEQNLDIEILLRLGCFLRIRGFCVRIDGITAYIEGA